MNREEYLAWEKVIGAFMVRFSLVEFEVTRGLIDFTNDDFENLKDLPFSKRVRKFKNNVCHMHLTYAKKKELYRNLEKLDKLASVRNLIAHSPLLLSIRSLMEDRSEGEIQSIRDPDVYLTKEDLSRHLEDLRNQEDVLYELLAEAGFSMAPT
ncbi:hypothetical protein [uncultured Spongiibacter sp.]|uniref:hypothetical protein n=1 Tax=uncultured Spongiibacter sp. TaxID=870896 RepID=UPI002592FBD8|nr:hypothetical protein [uncultured Spongiibacter sp.]